MGQRLNLRTDPAHLESEGSGGQQPGQDLVISGVIRREAGPVADIDDGLGLRKESTAIRARVGDSEAGEIWTARSVCIPLSSIPSCLSPPI